MSCPVIRIVDLQHNNEPVNLNELTELGLGELIYQCEQLIEELKDAKANIQD